MDKAYVVMYHKTDDEHIPMHVFSDEWDAKHDIEVRKLGSIREASPQLIGFKFDPLSFEFYRSNLLKALDILGSNSPDVMKYDYPVAKDKQLEVGTVLKSALNLCSDKRAREVGDLLMLTHHFYYCSVPSTIK